MPVVPTREKTSYHLPEMCAKNVKHTRGDNPLLQKRACTPFVLTLQGTAQNHHHYMTQQFCDNTYGGYNNARSKATTLRLIALWCCATIAKHPAVSVNWIKQMAAAVREVSLCEFRMSSTFPD